MKRDYCCVTHAIEAVIHIVVNQSWRQYRMVIGSVKNVFSWLVSSPICGSRVVCRTK